MHGLPCLTKCFHLAALDWTSQWLLEIVNESGLITLACKMRGLPCIRPWDIKFEAAMDVVSHGHIILSLIHQKYIVISHLQTTLARDPQIRSIEEPGGISGMDAHNQALLEKNNMLI